MSATINVNPVNTPAGGTPGENHPHSTTNVNINSDGVRPSRRTRQYDEDHHPLAFPVGMLALGVVALAIWLFLGQPTSTGFENQEDRMRRIASETIPKQVVVPAAPTPEAAPVVEPEETPVAPAVTDQLKTRRIAAQSEDYTSTCDLVLSGPAATLTDDNAMMSFVRTNASKLCGPNATENGSAEWDGATITWKPDPRP